MDTDPPPSGFSQPHPCSLDAETHAKLYQNGDPQHEYKRLILQLGDALEDEKLKDKIRYLHKDKLGTVGEDTKALILLRKLEEKGLFSARKLDALESLLRDIERCDLVESHLDPFRQKYGHQLSQAVTLQHSVSSPANTSSFPSRPQSAPLNRSTSFPVTAAVTSMPSRELCSIEEENLIHRAHGTHVSEKSLLVSGNFSSEIFSTLDQKMSGIGGGASPHPPNSRHREDPLGRVGRQCIAELNNSPRYPLRRASLTQASQELTPLKQINGGAGSSSVQVSSQAVSFEVGGLSSTLPHDCDSQLNFPMDNTTPSHSSTPAEVRSKPACWNLNDSLTKALTASFQQANERTCSNTPLPITTDKTSVEATDHGNDEACFVAGEGKSHPPKAVPNTAGLPTVPETTREVNAIACHPTAPPPSATVTPAATNGAAALDHATASIECSTTSMPGRVWHSKPELFLLNREKMAIMISKQKISHYHKRFNTTIPVSKSKKGVVHVSLEIFPYGRDADIETRHATVLAHVSYPLSSRKCKEMAENCNCVVEVKTTFFNVKTRDRLSSKEGKAELNPTSCEACVKITQALSHNDILYSKTNKIQMQVEATLRCQDKIVAVQSDDPDCKDYLLVTTNEPQDPLT